MNIIVQTRTEKKEKKRRGEADKSWRGDSNEMERNGSCGILLVLQRKMKQQNPFCSLQRSSVSGCEALSKMCGFAASEAIFWGLYFGYLCLSISNIINLYSHWIIGSFFFFTSK